MDIHSRWFREQKIPILLRLVAVYLPNLHTEMRLQNLLQQQGDWVGLDEDHSRNEVWNVLSLIEKGHIVRWLLQIYQDRMHQVS